MDDLILTGTLSLIGLYIAGILIVAGAVFVLVQVGQAAIAGDSGYIAEILTGIMILVAAYTGTGVWLQKRGRI